MSVSLRPCSKSGLPVLSGTAEALWCHCCALTEPSTGQVSGLRRLPSLCTSGSPLFFSSVQLLSRVQLFATPWTEARQASLSITNSQSLLKLMCIESVMPSNHLILCRPLLLLPSLCPSIRVFSKESALHIKVAKVLEFQLQHQSFQ